MYTDKKHIWFDVRIHTFGLKLISLTTSGFENNSPERFGDISRYNMNTDKLKFVKNYYHFKDI